MTPDLLKKLHVEVNFAFILLGDYMDNILLYTHSEPGGNGFSVQKRNDGECLSKEDCLIFGVPIGSKWGYWSGCIVAGKSCPPPHLSCPPTRARVHVPDAQWGGRDMRALQCRLTVPRESERERRREKWGGEAFGRFNAGSKHRVCNNVD